MITYLRKLYWNILWRRGVPIQCRSKTELDRNWHDMLKSEWPSCYSVETNWNFQNWEYRIGTTNQPKP